MSEAVQTRFEQTRAEEREASQAREEELREENRKLQQELDEAIATSSDQLKELTKSEKANMDLKAEFEEMQKLHG